MVLFPNPVAETLTIRLPTALPDSVVEILNSSGTLLARHLLSGQEGTLPVERLVPGKYILIFHQGNGIVMSRTFVKQ